MREKHILVWALQAAVLVLSVLATASMAANKENHDGTVLNFPAQPVGKIEITRINSDDPNKDKPVSKAMAAGKVIVPAGCAINLTLTYSGGQNTSFLLALPPEFVRRLDGNKLEIDDKQIVNISHLTKLVDLSLESTELTDSATRNFTGLKELRRLNLGDTEVTASGLACVAGMKKLRWLRLSRNIKLGDEIGPALSPLTSLKYLDLCGVNLHDKTLADLIPLANLEDLNLRRNNVTDNGMVYVAKLKNLKTLDLMDSLVRTNGLKLLVALPKLKTVVIRTKSFKLEELAALKKSLPGVTLENGSREQEVPDNIFNPLH